MTDEIDEFVTALAEADPEIRTNVDRPDDPNGETFLDLVAGDFSTAVSYRLRWASASS